MQKQKTPRLVPVSQFPPPTQRPSPAHFSRYQCPCCTPHKSLLQVFDYDRDDSVDCIGSLQTTLHAILSTPGWTAPLKDPKGKKKEVGSIVAGLAQLVQQPTFLNYIQGGLEVGLFVAIDFTASNGNPQDPRSLHYNRRGAARGRGVTVGPLPGCTRFAPVLHPLTAQLSRFCLRAARTRTTRTSTRRLSAPLRTSSCRAPLTTPRGGAPVTL